MSKSKSDLVLTLIRFYFKHYNLYKMDRLGCMTDAINSHAGLLRYFVTLRRALGPRGVKRAGGGL